MKSFSLLLLLLVCVQWTQARLLPSPSSNANLDIIPTHQPLQSPTLLRALLRARAGPNVPNTNWRLPSKKEDLPPQLDSNSIERVDEIQAIPFTRQRGPARFNGIPPFSSSGKIEEGVGPAMSFPAPIVSSVASINKPSSIIDDDEDDLLMSDDGPTVAATVVTTTGNVVPTASLLKESLNGRSLSSSSLPSVQYSELHPVYIKPPEDFKPVLYAHRRADGAAPGSRASIAVAQPVSAQSGLPYAYPNGLSSWMLGGFRGIQRGGYWERLASDQALADRSKPLEQPARNWLLTPAAQDVWYVQTVRDQKQRQSSSSSSNQQPSITTDKVELVPLDAEVGDKDAYDASPSTLSRISVRPPVGHNKFVITSGQDLTMSESQQRPRAQKRS